MSELPVMTTRGVHTGLQGSSIEAFQADLRGALLRPGATGYDEARTVHNGMIDRRPALIARCAGTADVLACVRFAREHELLVSVRGGGHGVAGAAVLLVGYTGPLAEGEKLLRPLREFGPPLVDQIGPSPYMALQSIGENFNPIGQRNYPAIPGRRRNPVNTAIS